MDEAVATLGDELTSVPEQERSTVDNGGVVGEVPRRCSLDLGP
jgi:hypothetical protein